MELKLLTDLWNDAETAGMDEPELLRYRSNLLGSDLRLTNFGGGNTSAKLMQADPVTGEDFEVLWVKGSGGDLGTITRTGFATLYQYRLQQLRKRYRGPDHEDEMVDLYPLCTFGGNTRAASIDTPLHAFLPFPHVDHLHPDWAIALAASANGPNLLPRLRDEFGLNLIWLPWKRPGFELALWLAKAVEKAPGANGIILGSHGLFTWGVTGRACYRNTLQVIDRIGQFVTRAVVVQGRGLFGGARGVYDATGRGKQNDEDPEGSGRGKQRPYEVMVQLRGLLGGGIGYSDNSPDVMRFVNSNRASALAWQGTSCPDHFVRTRVRPLYVNLSPQPNSSEDLAGTLPQAVELYRRQYSEYYSAHCTSQSPAMRSCNPSVVLIPGMGMFTFGQSKSEARVTAEFYTNAIHVMEGATAMAELAPIAEPAATAVHNYVAINPAEAFNIEYWLLEEAKLQRLPPAKELSGKVALVVGASPGIGQAIAMRLAVAGAHIVVADIILQSAEEVVSSVRKQFPNEQIEAITVDVTDRESMRNLLQSVVERFGGLDILVHTAAVFHAPGSDGRTTDSQWRATLEVNLTGCMIAADEAGKLMKRAGLPGSIVLLSSANALVAKRGSWAYDVGKSALNHLIREMAVEFAPTIRVNGVAPASVVEGSVQFPRDRVVSSLSKYGIAFDVSYSTDRLRELLADFYAERTLLKRRVHPSDVAEAVALLAGNKLAATTGQIVAVDAGLSEAFLR